MSAVIQQNTPEWLELRKTCIGASDMAVIMGDSPWATPFQLWQEKAGLKLPKEINFAMQRGLDLEPMARKEFENITGTKVEPVVVFHAEHSWLMASLDGAYYHDGKITNIVEIKCASKLDHELAKKGKIPKKYYAQLQTQLAVTNLKMAYYFSFDGKKGVIVEVNRDDIYIERLIEKAIDFKRCIDQFIPPELTEKEMRQTDCQKIEDKDAEKLAERYFDLSNIIDDLNEQREDYKQSLIALGGGSDIQGQSFKLSKVTVKGRVDYDAILKGYEIEVNLDEFRKPSTESWRISKIGE